MFQKGLKTLVFKPARAAAVDQSCKLRLACCDGPDAEANLCHLRFFNWAGMAEKPADYLGVFACRSCHDAVDRRNMRDVSLWTFQDILRALGETLQCQFGSGIFTTRKERQ